jgi:Small nuclear RNA activating complex (SNAPc), subunit 1
MYMILPHLDARDLCYLTQARKLRRCAGHIADGPYIDLNADVPEEAQVAAVMVLYAAYYTQQCSPRVRIYASPAHVQALRTVAEVRAQIHGQVPSCGHKFSLAQYMHQSRQTLSQAARSPKTLPFCILRSSAVLLEYFTVESC